MSRSMPHPLRRAAAGLATTLLVLVSGLATAADATPRADKREGYQAARIEQGKASGQLTEREAKRLDAGQKRVATMEERAKADGVVTAGEKARLERAQDRQSRHIAKQKHDLQQDRDHDGKADRRPRARP